ncbi:YciI family protein [Euzebya rosea]|uniref:YciI family protein n=1 Tax=Euzebya rosea TaxID=2052804 RepID=UPI000D3E8AE7|nr:YciI family protein [Euzebya rosea]
MPQQYLFAVHHVEGEAPPSPEVMEQMFADVDAFNTRVMDEGRWVFGGGLEPRETATVVRAVDGDHVITDGPFIEAREWIGGFWVLTAEDLDEALALAKDASTACRGPVEVRPFQPEPEE